MKKLFCVLTVVCMLASLVCVSALAGPNEQDEQILAAAEPTATATATNAEPVTPVLYGDANGDGVVNMKDVLAVRKHIADLPVELDLAAADVNRDKTVNMKDVLALRQIVAYGNIYGEQNPLAYTLEERVAEIGGGDSVFENFPKVAILRSPADVEALFAKSSHYNFSTGTSAPVYPKNTYDDAFFAEKFLVALRVDNGYIDDENPVSGVFQGESGSLVIHTNNDWQYSPWTEQDVLLISLPLSELEGLHTVYEVRRTPQLIFETGEITGYSYALEGRYNV